MLSRLTGELKRSVSKKNGIICKGNSVKWDVDTKPWIISPFGTRAEI